MIILHVQKAFEDVSSSKRVRVLNMARLHMLGLRRVPNMSDYGSIHLNNASLSLNISKHCSIFLSMPEKTVLTMPGL